MSMTVSGNSLDTADDLNVAVNYQVFSDTLIGSHSNFYSFTLTGRSSFHLDLENTSVNKYIDLIQDANANGVLDEGEVIKSSLIGITNAESINETLDGGLFYIRVYGDEGVESNYELSVAVTSVSSSVFPPTPTSEEISPANVVGNVLQPLTSNTNTIKGTLRADTFTYQPNTSQMVISGNGNVDFGTGARDLLDLGQFSSQEVTINYVGKTGGVSYNPGNGTRLFDAITLSNGKTILFEGIETIKFANETINLSVIPNDPLFGQQWNLHMMGVQNAWRFATGSNKVLIGIEDTGLAANGSNLHPDLRTVNKLSNNYLDEMTYPTAHGTSVTGVIAATSNNGQGISGIDWNSSVFHIDVMGGNAGDYDLVGATQTLINQASDKGQRLVVNLSLTGGSSPQFEQLIANNQNTALFVIAGGNNDSNSLESPANLANQYSNVMAVGASSGVKDWYGNSRTPGQRISYKDIGWWSSNKGDGLTVMGPSEFLTTNATKSSGVFDFGYNDKFNGTSAAVPNVTGVASIVWGANPNLSASQVKSVLSETAYDLGSSGYDTEYGYGFVNADAAVRRSLALAQGAA